MGTADNMTVIDNVHELYNIIVSLCLDFLSLIFVMVVSISLLRSYLDVRNNVLKLA